MFDRSTYFSTTAPTGRLRWRSQPPSEGKNKALQQEFETIERESGKRTTEWRDVSMVAE